MHVGIFVLAPQHLTVQLAFELNF